MQQNLDLLRVPPTLERGTVSNRSRQAQRLARRLTSLTGTFVEVVHQSGQQYLVQWGNGPTTDTMVKQVSQELAHFPYLSARMLRFSRGYSARAFAARAVACQRDGTLAIAVATGVQERHRFGITSPSWSHLSDEELTAHQHIESLIEQTAYPDRADSPADEPAIEALIRVSGGDEFAMLPTLLSPDHHQPTLSTAQREPEAL
jgi:hypothetical protein